MSLNLDPGHTLCPSCSGIGVRILSESTPKPTCTLCFGEGQVTPERAEEFWECVRVASQGPGMGRTLYSCVSKAWP